MPLTSSRTSTPPAVAGDRGRRDVPSVTVWSPWSAVGSTLAFLLLLAGAGPAVASDDRVAIELNKLEDVGEGCRLTLVMTNRLDAGISALTLETVLFDADDRVDRFLLVSARPLPPSKIRVQQFDVGDIACDGIGRVLLNDVTRCEGAGLDPAQCLARIETSSRTEAEFVSTVGRDDDAGAAP